MSQRVVFNYAMVSSKVPTMFLTLYDYPRGHHSHSFVSKNGPKWFKNMFLIMLTSITSYSMSGVQLPYGINLGAC
jgi:hypothetical protein